MRDLTIFTNKNFLAICYSNIIRTYALTVILSLSKDITHINTIPRQVYHDIYTHYLSKHVSPKYNK